MISESVVTRFSTMLKIKEDRLNSLIEREEELSEQDEYLSTNEFMDKEILEAEIELIEEFLTILKHA